MGVSLAIVAITAYNDSENRKDAKETRAQSDRQFAESMALTKEQDAYRRQLVDDMMRDAEMSDAEYERAISQSSADVTRAFDKARGMEIRTLGRMGINPNSGRFDAMNRQLTLGQAANDAQARNATRLTLATEERSRMNEARKAGLGLNSDVANLLADRSRTNLGLSLSLDQQRREDNAAAIGAIGTAYGRRNSQSNSTTATSTSSNDNSGGSSGNRTLMANSYTTNRDGSSTGTRNNTTYSTQGQYKTRRLSYA